MARSAASRLKQRLTPASARFTRIYREQGFGRANSASGPGSELDQTAVLQRELPGLLRELDVHSLLDIPCGDFHWMKQVNLAGVHYTGGDVVPDVVARNNELYGSSSRSFRRLDMTRDELPQVDAIFCRDCWVHLSLADSTKALRQAVRSGSKYLLATTFPTVDANADIITAMSWRPLNLQRPPFNLPPPIKLLNEQCTEHNGKYADKSIGVWKISDIHSTPQLT